MILPSGLLSLSSLAQPQHVIVFVSEYHDIVLHLHRQVPLPSQGVKAFQLDAFHIIEEVSAITLGTVRTFLFPYTVDYKKLLPTLSATDFVTTPTLNATVANYGKLSFLRMYAEHTSTIFYQGELKFNRLSSQFWLYLNQSKDEYIILSDLKYLFLA